MIVKKTILLTLIILLGSSFCSQNSFASSALRLTREEINTFFEKNDYSLKKILIQTCAQLGIIVPWAAIGVFGGNIATKYTFDRINNYIDKSPQTNAAQLLNHCHGELAIMAGVLTSLFFLKTGFKAISYICSIKDPWISDLDILIYLLVPLLSETHLSLLRKHIKKTYYSDKSKEAVAYYPSPGKTPSQSP